MKKLLLTALLLGSANVAWAQVSAPILQSDTGNVAPDFSSTSAARATLLGDLAAPGAIFVAANKPADTFPAPLVATALALPLETAEPASPSPQPKFLYGGRDDYRWELGLGASWVRFRSSVFNASAVGVSTSVVYFTNEWFGVEGNLTAVFAPTIYLNERVKIATYGAGPKIAWRQRRWEPWMHGIFGGAHEQPQVSGSSRNSYAIKAGGGADYRWNPRISFRLEGDYLRTGFFHSSQNSFQLAGGIVFHF
jgi:opacity protein-like surface antigen